MEETQKTYAIGSIVSADLTVPNADAVRDFYREVIGWEVENMTMRDDAGEYNDYIMKDGAGNWSGGVCHKRGQNSDLPSQWIVYINVADVDQSAEACERLGGKVLKLAKNDDGPAQYALLEDPAGAVIAVTKV
jgi:predicted enzyme related to lactoylglutathione lyase